jgi:hypothetical protein
MPRRFAMASHKVFLHMSIKNIGWNMEVVFFNCKGAVSNSYGKSDRSILARFHLVDLAPALAC